MEAMALTVGVCFLVGKHIRADEAPPPGGAIGRPSQDGPGLSGEKGGLKPGDPSPGKETVAEGIGAQVGFLRNPRLVIEKSAHRLTLYDGSRFVKSYRAAVGEGLPPSGRPMRGPP